jgi:hypothetical protein
VSENIMDRIAADILRRASRGEEIDYGDQAILGSWLKPAPDYKLDFATMSATYTFENLKGLAVRASLKAGEEKSLVQWVIDEVKRIGPEFAVSL